MVTLCPEVLITFACLVLLILSDFTAISLHEHFTCISPLLVVIISIYSHFLSFIICRFIYSYNKNLSFFFSFYRKYFAYLINVFHLYWRGKSLQNLKRLQIKTNRNKFDVYCHYTKLSSFPPVTPTLLSLLTFPIHTLLFLHCLTFTVLLLVAFLLSYHSKFVSSRLSHWTHFIGTNLGFI